jgi:hypothetical protein
MNRYSTDSFVKELAPNPMLSVLSIISLEHHRLLLIFTSIYKCLTTRSCVRVLFQILHLSCMKRDLRHIGI